jgi:hypothetical protein
MTHSFLAVPALAVALVAGPAAGPALSFEFCSKAAEPRQLAQNQSTKRKRDDARSSAGDETAGAKAAESAQQGRQQ